MTRRTLLVVVLVRFLSLYIHSCTKLRATKPPEGSLLIHDCHI